MHSGLEALDPLVEVFMGFVKLFLRVIAECITNSSQREPQLFKSCEDFHFNSSYGLNTHFLFLASITGLSKRLEGVPTRSFLPKRLVHLEVGLAGCHSYICKVA